MANHQVFPGEGMETIAELMAALIVRNDAAQSPPPDDAALRALKARYSQDGMRRQRRRVRFAGLIVAAVGLAVWLRAVGWW